MSVNFDVRGQQRTFSLDGALLDGLWTFLARSDNLILWLYNGFVSYEHTYFHFSRC